MAEHSERQPELLNSRQAAEMLGTTVEALRHRRRVGHLRGRLYGRRWYYSPVEIQRFIDQHCHTPLTRTQEGRTVLPEKGGTVMEVWVSRRKRRGKAKGFRYCVRYGDKHGAYKQDSTHETRAAAIERREALRRQLCGGSVPLSRRGNVTWEDWIEEERRDYAPTVRAATWVETERALRLFAEFSGARCLAETDLAAAKMFRRRRRGQGVREATVNKDCRHVKASLNRGKDLGYILVNPFDKVPLPPAPSRKRILRAEEERKLFAKCDDEMLRIFVHTALQTGARRGELLALKWEDVDLRSGRIQIRWSKTKHGIRTVNTDVAGTGMLRRVNEQTTGRRVFCPDDAGAGYARGLLKRFQEAAEAAEVSPLTIQNLRQTNLTRLAEGGLPPAHLQAWAGHSSISTTMRYYVQVEAGRVLEAVDRARAALSGANCVTTALPQGGFGVLPEGKKTTEAVEA